MLMSRRFGLVDGREGPDLLFLLFLVPPVLEFLFQHGLLVMMQETLDIGQELLDGVASIGLVQVFVLHILSHETVHFILFTL